MLNEILKNIQEKNVGIVAIDGRCAAGKTTLANSLQKILACNLIHMDDFFLRPTQRTEERLKEPGGNIDYERFTREVLLPLKAGTAFSYRPFDCHAQSFKAPVSVSPEKVTLIEGSYACHPKFTAYYDLRIFLDVDSETQLDRIRKRNGADAAIFQTRWIPMEEIYFETYRVKEQCEMTFFSPSH